MPYITDRVKSAVEQFRTAFNRDPRVVYLRKDSYDLYVEENSPQPGEMSGGFRGHQQSGIDVRPFNEAPSEDSVQLQIDATPETDLVTVG